MTGGAGSAGRWAAVLGAVLATAVPFAEARAQPADPPPAVFEVRAGAVSAKGDLGDVADDGQMVALSLGYRVVPRLTLRAEGALHNLERGGRPGFLGGGRGPDVELWHYTAVASLELTDPRRSRWEVVVHGGAGGTRVEADATERLEAVSRTEPVVMAALGAGYDLTRHVTLFARADGYLVLGEAPSPDSPAYLGQEMVLTHSGGLRFSF